MRRKKQCNWCNGRGRNATVILGLAPRIGLRLRDIGEEERAAALDPRVKPEDDGMKGSVTALREMTASLGASDEACAVMSKTGKAILVRFLSAVR